MPKLQRWCLVLLVALFGALCLAEKRDKKVECRGYSIKLFERISFDNNHTTVSLHKNGETDLMIAKWENYVGTPNAINGYSDKLYLDKFGNMWVLNLRESDDAIYTIVTTDKDSNKTTDKVELLVLVAPTTNCKPKITKVGDSLSAHVDPRECGKPAASVYWLEHSGISAAPEVIELQSGRHDCTYHACIKGEAIRCANVFNLSDYCTVFKDHTSNSPLNTTGMIIAILVLVTAIVMFAIILVMWKIISRYRRKKTNKKSTPQERKGAHALLARGNSSKT